MEDHGEVVDVVLPNGATMRVAVVEAQGAQDAGLLDALDLDGMRETIEGHTAALSSVHSKG